MSEQSTQHIMMLEPADFYANPQTMETNHYQAKNPEDTEAIQEAAVAEFRMFHNTLIENGVIITAARGLKGCPDDIYVNNWVSTHAGDKMVLYPMLAENRRIERRPDLVRILSQSYDVALDLTAEEQSGRFLESTGALVMDRVNHVAYCTLSERADEALAKRWAEKMDYELITFRTESHAGEPIYHTDIMMYIGTGYAGLCTSSIVEEDRDRVLDRLGKTHEIIDISMDQIKTMCGNALEVQSTDKGKLLVMSGLAYGHYTDEQKETFLKYVDKIVYANIPTIEKYGGGSARCMLLELF